MLKTLFFYAGFFLIIILCTEEFRRGLGKIRTALKRSPHWKYLAYPLAILVGLAAMALMVNSLLTLIIYLKFSYD